MKYLAKLSAINPDNLVNQYQSEWLAKLPQERLDKYVRVHESADAEQVIVGADKPFSLEKAQEYSNHYGWELRQ